MDEKEDDIADGQEVRHSIHDHSSDDESELEVQYQDASAILDNDISLEHQLPKHQKYAYHLLNLISTVEATTAGAGSEMFRRLSRSAFTKCSALWNKTSRAAEAFETVECECKLQFL